MLLTDPALQYWTCVAAILATIAVLALWNRVQGPAPVKVLSRVGLLLAGYLTTAVAILVSVNIAYGGLIVSMSDLFADVNPPMGQFMHHNGCKGAVVHHAAAAPVAEMPPPCAPNPYRQTNSKSAVSLSNVDNGMATASVVKSK
jgi:hypothetical protein